MAGILQTKYQSTFFWMNIFEFLLTIHNVQPAKAMIDYRIPYHQTGDKSLSQPLVVQLSGAYVWYPAHFLYKKSLHIKQNNTFLFISYQARTFIKLIEKAESP